MCNILKQFREMSNKTQEELADQMGVSVGTIQNWESGRTLISAPQFHIFCDKCNITNDNRNKALLELFGKQQTAEKTDEKDNFPYFLFEEETDLIERARDLTLSEEEMELFGYDFYMSHFTDKPLDYAIFKDHGGFFRTKGMIDDIENRLKTERYDRDDDLKERVYLWGFKNPGRPFKYTSLPPKEIEETIKFLSYKYDISDLYEKCKLIEDGICLDHCNEYDLRNSGLDRIVKVSRGYMNSKNTEAYFSGYTNEILRKCFEIIKKDSDNPEYLKEKEQYLSDLKEYEKHPGLYQAMPEFKQEYSIYLQLTKTGKEYIKWYERS